MSEATLITATLTTGLMAGIFFGFSCSVMLALARVDDRTYVVVMQRINAAIQNGLFGLVFLGALAATSIAVWRYADRPEVLRWLVAALAGYVVTLAITFTVNIPLNNRLDRAGPGARLADPGAARRDFEKPWVRWNNIRALTCTLAFGCLCAALLAA